MLSQKSKYRWTPIYRCIMFPHPISQGAVLLAVCSPIEAVSQNAASIPEPWPKHLSTVHLDAMFICLRLGHLFCMAQRLQPTYLQQSSHLPLCSWPLTCSYFSDSTLSHCIPITQTPELEHLSSFLLHGLCSISHSVHQSPWGTQ